MLLSAPQLIMRTCPSLAMEERALVIPIALTTWGHLFLCLSPFLPPIELLYMTGTTNYIRMLTSKPGLSFIPILSQPGWLRIPRTKSLHSTCLPTQPQASQQLSKFRMTGTPFSQRRKAGGSGERGKDDGGGR